MRKWYVISCLLLMVLTTMAQDAGNANTLFQQYEHSRPDSFRVQLLLKLSNFYLVKPGEVKTDLDTALLLARQAGELSQQLHYAAGQDNADFQVGTVYIEFQNYAPAYQLLEKLSDTSRIKLMLKITDYKIGSQTTTPKGYDTALLYAQRALAISNSIHSVNWQLSTRIRFANYYMITGNIRQGHETLRHVFDSSLLVKYMGGVLDVHGWMLAWQGTDTSLYTTMLECSNALVTDYYKQKDAAIKEAMQPVIIDWMAYDGWALFNRTRFAEAEEQMLRAVDFQRSFTHPDFNAYETLSHAYIVRGKFDLGLQYSLEAIRLLEASGNKELEDRFYWNTAYIYFQTGKDSLSLDYYQKAVAINQQKGTIIPARYLRIYAAAMLRHNNPAMALALLQENLKKSAQHNLYDLIDRRILILGIADCYNAMGNIKQAEQYYLENLALAQLMPVRAFTITSWFDLANFYVMSHQYEKGKFYLDKIAADKEKIILSFGQLTGMENLLFKVDSVAGNYLAAIGHQNQYKIMNDSLYTLARNKQMEEVKAKYETEKKDHDLVLKDKDLQQTRLLRNIFVGGALMLVLLLGVLYNRYRIKQRSNRLLQEHQVEMNQSNQQLQRLNERLQKLVFEKEWLIKEVHHRVKNNLQIVISLLNMQTHYLKDEFALQAFGDAGHRIRAISLIHQKLYQEENMTMIDMPDYIRELVTFLGDSSLGMRIRFELHIDPIELDVSQSVPVGLILNEAITNAIKYAFHKDVPGTISISLTMDGDKMVVLRIADDGCGLPEHFNAANHTTLGFQLMNTLSEQLEGCMTVESSPGVAISVRFEKTVLPVASQLLEASAA